MCSLKENEAYLVQGNIDPEKMYPSQNILEFLVDVLLA